MDEMIKTITFDDVEYYVMDKIMHNDVVYVYLVNSGDMDDIIIRKVCNEESKFYLSQLEEKEFDEIMEKFIEKMNKEY